ncbi:hypothetical protein BH11PLA2_BH11PLA2_49590 [soil metagenome]
MIMRNALLLLIAFAPVATAQGDPVAVVKKAIEAHGGADALNKSRTARSTATGTMTNRGQDVPFTATAVYAMPDKFHMEVTLDINGGKFVVTQILNGKKTKVTAKLGSNDTPLDPKQKEETAQAGLLQDISSLTPLLDKKYTLKAEKDADLNGNAAAVVSVTGNGLKEVKLFFDKATGRLVKTERQGYANTGTGVVEVKQETYLSDFKKFGNAMLPTATVVNHDGKKFMTMTIADIKFADKIDEKEFSTD